MLRSAMHSGRLRDVGWRIREWLAASHPKLPVAHHDGPFPVCVGAGRWVGYRALDSRDLPGIRKSKFDMQLRWSSVTISAVRPLGTRLCWLIRHATRCGVEFDEYAGMLAQMADNARGIAKR